MAIRRAGPSPVQADFERVFRANRARIERCAFAIVGDRQLAADIAQEAFCRALSRWPRVSRYDSPEAWLWTVTVRLALRARTDGGRREAIGDVGAIDAYPSDSSDVRAAVWALPREQRAAIVLYYLEGRPVSEIASILGKRPGTIKAQLHAGRNSLRTRLAEHYGR